jgi:hypothetical protein
MGTNLSTARLKTVTTLGPAFVVAVAPFPALAPGEFDNFCFDFTAHAGATGIASTTWTASFDPGNTAASDTSPQARVITAFAATSIYVRSPINFTLQAWAGQFSVATIGGSPPSAAGGTYSLAAWVSLSDTRILVLTASLPCLASSMTAATARGTPTTVSAPA